MSRNRKGSDGITDSGTMPWNDAELTPHHVERADLDLLDRVLFRTQRAVAGTP
jgi:hypothetical protein